MEPTAVFLPGNPTDRGFWQGIHKESDTTEHIRACARAHTHTHTHAHTHVHTHTHTHAHTHAYTCMHAHAHTRACAHGHTHAHTRTHTRAHMHTHTCARTHMHTRTHTRTHTRAQCIHSPSFTTLYVCAFGKVTSPLYTSISPSVKSVNTVKVLCILVNVQKS